MEVLRTVLLLPKPETEFVPMMPELEILDYLIDLGYDVQDDLPLTKHSRFNVKYMPQPWRTFYMLVVRSISGRKSGHEHPRLEHLQVFWGMVSMLPIDFAKSIMSDMVYHIQSDRERTMIPFVRFTKLLIEHFCKDQPEYISRMQDHDEPKNLYEDDFTIAFVKMTMFSTKQQGKRIPDYLLDDKIRKTKNFELYDKAYQGRKVGLT